ncbi:MAG: DUF799 family lipoprotein [Smithellaceae bacterium]
MTSQRLLFLLCTWLLFTGCASKANVVSKNDPPKVMAGVIALMPVENQTTDTRAPGMLREKILDELHFKGYQKLSPEAIDRSLTSASPKDGADRMPTLPSGQLKEALGADAVMYCTLMESRVSVTLLYAPARVAARCELRSANTGEILWSASYSATSRSFGITPARVRLKSYSGFESALEEVVAGVMETLPYGPGLRG